MPADEDFVTYSPALVFVADARGLLACVSQTLRDQFDGLFAPGKTLSSLTTAAQRAVVDDFISKLAPADGSRSCTFHLTGEGDDATSLGEIHCQARRGPNGRIHGLVEVSAPTEQKTLLEKKLLRTVMDTLDIVLWAVDQEGNFVYHQGKALATAGLTPNQFLGLNVFDLYPTESNAQVQAALDGTPSHYKSDFHGINWETWNVPVDNALGGVELCVGLTLDITQTTQSAAELTRQLQTIRDQQKAIQDLSVPLLEVWDHVLTVPLVGVIDDDRARALIDRLLTKVNASGARFTIIDLTGVESLDSSTASHIIRLLGSLRLLGVEGIITGISPAVAQIMVELGIDLPTITTCRTLRDGLRHCMKSG